MCNCRKNKRTIDPGTAAAMLTDQQISELVASAQTIAARTASPATPATPATPTAVQ